MRDYIYKRVLEVADHISRTKDTVRDTASVFGVSKSTIHKDVTERLPRVHKELALRVKHVLDTNKAERHLRGGQATRLKYLDPPTDPPPPALPDPTPPPAPKPRRGGSDANPPRRQR